MNELPTAMDDSRPLKVSVILCNYNYGRFVAEAIRSVLTQTYSHFELLIVDDGSTDDSAKVISSFDDPRIRFISKENGGQASAFNSAFSAARGELVSFLDSDDGWFPEKLATVVRWHRFLEGDYAVLQHSLSVREGEKATSFKHILPTGDCFQEMRTTHRIDYFTPTSGLSFRKETLNRIFPLPGKLCLCADAYITRTAFVFGRVFSIPDALGFYRKHTNAVMGNREFRASRFFTETLFPELNAFYRNAGIEYRMSSKNNVDIRGILMRAWLTRGRGT